MQSDEKLKKRIAYEKMLAGISERGYPMDIKLRNEGKITNRSSLDPGHG